MASPSTEANALHGDAEDLRSMEDNTKTRSGLTRSQLAEVMGRFDLITNPRVGKLDHASKLLKEYLLAEELQFVKCIHYRDQGWLNKEAGDEHFKKQRDNADNASLEEEKVFFDMMMAIANEMQQRTKAIKVQVSEPRQVKVLDICMAPGGYAAIAKEINSDAAVYGLTLNTSAGGHHVVMDKSDLTELLYLDVTLLVNEYSGGSAPLSHPHHYTFLDCRPFNSHKFDLVFCDGIKLRGHQVPTYRDEYEDIRLFFSQLILAMQRIAQNGTLIMLMRRIESWTCAYTLHTISKFASVKTFKPSRTHAIKGSFYMVAQNVRPDDDEAKLAVKAWKDIWWQTTFGGADGTGKMPQEPSEDDVQGLIMDFGKKLAVLGRKIWDIQGEALRKTGYAGDRGGMESSVSYSALWDKDLSSARTIPLRERSAVGSASWRKREPVTSTDRSVNKSAGVFDRRQSISSPCKVDENRDPGESRQRPRYNDYGSGSSFCRGYNKSDNESGYGSRSSRKNFGSASQSGDGRPNHDRGDTGRALELRSLGSWRDKSATPSKSSDAPKGSQESSPPEKSKQSRDDW